MEVSPAHLMAYIDALAQKRNAQDLGIALTDRDCRDPFSQKVDFLKKELKICKTLLESQCRKTHAAEISRALAECFNAACRNEMDSIRDKLPQTLKDDFRPLEEMNSKITWLMGKAWLSMRFPLFLGMDDMLVPGVTPEKRKESVWQMYLDSVNISSMSEILENIRQANAILGTLPPETLPFYDIIAKMDAYFYCVIQFLDAFGCPSDPSGHASGGKKDGQTSDFTPPLEAVRKAGEDLKKAIQARIRLLRQLFAVVYSSLPDPEFEHAANLYKERGALERRIRASRMN